MLPVAGRFSAASRLPHYFTRATLTFEHALAWPPDMYSLAHIALPFTLEDEVYGRHPRASASAVVRLGTLSPRGERAVLTVPMDTLMRVSCNPFFAYLAERLTAWADAAANHIR